MELFTEHYREALTRPATLETGFRIYVVGSRGEFRATGPHPRGMEEFL